MNLENLHGRLKNEVVYLRLMGSLRSIVEYREFAEFLGVYSYSGYCRFIPDIEEAIFRRIMTAVPDSQIDPILRPFHYYEVSGLVRNYLTVDEQESFLKFLLAKEIQDGTERAGRIK